MDTRYKSPTSLPPGGSNSVVQWMIQSSLWDQAEVRLQLRPHPCLASSSVYLVFFTPFLMGTLPLEIICTHIPVSDSASGKPDLRRLSSRALPVTETGAKWSRMNTALGSYELSLFLKTTTISNASGNGIINVIVYNPFLFWFLNFLSLMVCLLDLTTTAPTAPTHTHTHLRPGQHSS